MASDHRSRGQLVVIGGAEDLTGGSGILRAFAGLSGGARARIVVVTTASGTPGSSFDRYSAALARLGVPEARELRLSSRPDADGDRAVGLLRAATGVFFSGGDQSRLAVLVGSQANRLLADRLAERAVVIGGTSAGATVLGQTMITAGRCASGDHALTVSGLHTGPGLGLLPGVIVDMHFAERRRFPRLLAAVLRQPSHLGLGIDEDTAMVVGPGRFDVLGRGAVTTVDARLAGDRDRVDVRVHRLYAGRAFDLDRRRPAVAAGPFQARPRLPG